MNEFTEIQIKITALINRCNVETGENAKTLGEAVENVIVKYVALKNAQSN